MKYGLYVSIWIALVCVGCSQTDSLDPSDPTESASESTEAFEPERVFHSSSEELSDEVSPEGIEIEALIREPSYLILGAEEADEEPAGDFPEQAQEEPEDHARKSDFIGQAPVLLCKEIGAKLGSVDESDCLRQNLITTDGKSVEGRDLAIKDYLPVKGREPLGRVLVIGGIHGDEFSSVSVVFKWMDILNEHHSGLFHWRFIPAANPDGLLREKSQRQNANGVDLNRNFPTSDWQKLALDYWSKKTGQNTRRFPGQNANNQPETQWLVGQIRNFKPDVIISMHAPYHLVDYDGPPTAPNQLGSLYLRKLGVYPGSLGNYAGVDLDLPIVTVELASAGIMPSRSEISEMWDDLIGWLRTKLSK